MPNCIFQFKEFAVWSHIGGFKVGTDAVLMGAWTGISDNQSVLDVGTGTGVISLMIAQRANTSLTAVELDRNAATQAKFNFQRSKFGRLTVVNSSVQDFSATTTKQFDHIVCNPPFFQFSSKPNSETLQKAKHTDTLCPSDVLKSSSKMISESGKVSIVIPYKDEQEWLSIGNSMEFYPTRKLLLRPAPEFDIKRVLVEFGRVDASCEVNEIIVEEGERNNRSYTTEFQKMMKDYFIRF